MGVPSYFKWLYDNHRSSLLSHKCPYKEVSSLYLDFNCLIHPACKERDGLTEKEMLHNVERYFRTIVDFVKPSDLIYVAVDGVVPVAKMEQQRKRRFRSAADKIFLDDLKKKYNMKCDKNDYNMISPGTTFMKKLDKMLHSLKFDTKMVISGSDVPGEGEHKIMDHIRSSGQEKSSVVYGLDADLIFLCLVNFKKELTLVRESTFFGSSSDQGYLYVRIPELRLLLHNNLAPKEQHTELATSPYVQKTMIDYAYMCFLHGNDFLPHIPSMLIREGALDIAIEAYKKIRNKSMFVNLVQKGCVNSVILLQLLQELQSVEEAQLKKITDARNKRVSRALKQKSFLNYEQEVNNYNYIEPRVDDKIMFGYPGWKERYVDSLNEDEIKQGCQDYLDGMFWSVKYYTQGCIDWGWKYNSCYVPCISDLYSMLKLGIINPNKMKDNEPVLDNPVSTDVQLLYILPPQSKSLVPVKLRNLMKPGSIISDYYPETFCIDTKNKKLLWECDPLLCDIDIHLLIRIVQAKNS